MTASPLEKKKWAYPPPEKVTMRISPPGSEIDLSPPEAGKLDYPPPDFVPDPLPWSSEIYDPPEIFDLPGGGVKKFPAREARRKITGTVE